MIGLNLHHTVGRGLAVAIPAFQLHPVRAAVAKGKQGIVLHVARGGDWRMIEAGDQYHLFAKGDAAIEIVMGDRAIHQRGRQGAFTHPIDDFARGAGNQRQRHFGEALVIGGEQAGQTRRRGALH